MKPTEHRHRPRHRHQGERQALPRARTGSRERARRRSADGAELDRALVRERAIGRSSVSCCPGGQSAGAAARSPVDRAPRPASVPLPARADADPDHDRAVRVFRDRGRVGRASPARSASAPPPAMPGRSARSPSARCCCSCSPRSTCPSGRSSCSRPWVDVLVHTAGVPIVLAILLALVVACGVGAINGLITVRLNVPSFVTTLATNFILFGVVLVCSNDAEASPIPLRRRAARPASPARSWASGSGRRSSGSSRSRAS